MKVKQITLEEDIDPSIKSKFEKFKKSAKKKKDEPAQSELVDDSETRSVFSSSQSAVLTASLD